jgi:hypothetical protein
MEWTDKEVCFLREHYKDMTGRELGDVLGRTPDAVQLKASAIGLSKPLKGAWSEEEEKYLKRMYLTLTIKQLADRLDRTEYSVKRKLQRMDLNKYYDCIYVRTLANAFLSDSSVVNRWIEKYELLFVKRADKKRGIRERVFWKWADKNRNIIPFYKYQKGMLRYEPDWLNHAIAESKKEKERKTVSEWDRDYILSQRRKGMYLSEISKKIDKPEYIVKYVCDNAGKGA